MKRYVRELEVGDQIALGDRWFTVTDIASEGLLTRLAFAEFDHDARLDSMMQVECAS